MRDLGDQFYFQFSPKFRTSVREQVTQHLTEIQHSALSTPMQAYWEHKFLLPTMASCLSQQPLQYTLTGKMSTGESQGKVISPALFKFVLMTTQYTNRHILYLLYMLLVMRSNRPRC